jgi:DNA (cytosine-5)-methyltransferase 1
LTAYGSVCSGIEAATVAWHPIGWSPAWFAEIEKFPSSVLAHHYPAVANLGDMTKIAAMVRAGIVAAPDVLVGGTPCQAFSIAGLRASMDDARGQLTLSFVDLANAIDSVRHVRGEPESIIVWENVPGVLSTSDNAFGCFLGAIAGEDSPLVAPGGRWSNAGCVYGPRRRIAWRTLDAQYTGVAQRRRRVFVVASARNGFDPTEVLFEFDGVRRDTAPRREAWQDVTGTISARTSGGGGRGTDFECAGGIQPVAFGGNNQSGSIDVATARNASASASASASGRMDFETETFLVQPVLSVALRGRDGGATAELGDEVATCLRASGGGGDKAHVLAPICFSSKDHGVAAMVDCAPTLRSGNHDKSHANGGQPPAIAFVQNSRDEVRLMNGDGQIVGALAAETGAKQQCYVAHLLAFDARQDTVSSTELFGALGSSSPQAQAVCITGDITHTHTHTHTLKADGFDASEDGTGRGQPIVSDTAMARRLTPVECERLQGFPGNYTFIPTWNGWRKMDSSETPESCIAEGLDIKQNKKTLKWPVKDVDGPRYRAIGNSMAVPVMHWIGKRIDAALQP